VCVCVCSGEVWVWASRVGGIDMGTMTALLVVYLWMFANGILSSSGEHESLYLSRVSNEGWGEGGLVRQ
jgi:hypothetical protein